MIVKLEEAEKKYCPMNMATGDLMNCLGSKCMAWTGVTNEYGVMKEGLARGYCGMLPARGGY